MPRPFAAMLTSFALTSILLLATAPADAAEAPPAKTLRDTIAERETELFALYFEGCDRARLAGMVTDDLEFYHDRTGAQFGAKRFLDDYERQCTGRAAPDAWLPRRALVPESLHVDAVPGYGAIEDGEHLFYGHQRGKAEQLDGRARFTMIWKNDGGTWKLARVVSFAHAPAGR